MLTNEQCIEIADKVWGWEFDVTRSKLNGMYLCGIQNQVNSWQGFGRTVEAMADRTHCAFYGKLKAHLAQYFMDESKEKLNGLFEMVHLDALEAMKIEKLEVQLSKSQERVDQWEKDFMVNDWRRK